MALKHVVVGVVFGMVALLGASAAHAGWVIEESNIATRPKGEPGPAEPATTRISQGRVRITQPSTITVQDQVKQRFTIFVSDRNTYWSGTVDEYVAEINADRRAAKPGANLTKKERKKVAAAKRPKKPPLDVANLPKITIRKFDEHAKIAGYETTLYQVDSNGKRFQEIWMTDAINMKDDLDPKRYNEYQLKLSAMMRGAAAPSFNALYRSPEYLTLMQSGFPLKTTIYHIAGSYTREVRSITKADVSDGDFELPSTAQQTSLNDLFGPAPGK